MTPSFKGRMATMFPGVRPSISLASRPTAKISPLTMLMATMEGSLTTTPLPRAKTRVLAVPRSIARSDENTLNKERTFITSSTPALVESETARGGSLNNPSLRHDDLSITCWPAVTVQAGKSPSTLFPQFERNCPSPGWSWSQRASLAECKPPRPALNRQNS